MRLPSHGLAIGFEAAFRGRLSMYIINWSAFLSDDERFVVIVVTRSVWRCDMLATPSAYWDHQERYVSSESVLAGSDLGTAFGNALVESIPLVFALTARGGELCTEHALKSVATSKVASLTFHFHTSGPLEPGKLFLSVSWS